MTEHQGLEHLGVMVSSKTSSHGRYLYFLQTCNQTRLHPKESLFDIISSIKLHFSFWWGISNHMVGLPYRQLSLYSLKHGCVRMPTKWAVHFIHNKLRIPWLPVWFQPAFTPFLARSGLSMIYFTTYYLRAWPLSKGTSTHSKITGSQKENNFLSVYFSLYPNIKPFCHHPMYIFQNSRPFHCIGEALLNPLVAWQYLIKSVAPFVGGYRLPPATSSAQLQRTITGYPSGFLWPLLVHGFSLTWVIVGCQLTFKQTYQLKSYLQSILWHQYHQVLSRRVKKIILPGRELAERCTLFILDSDWYTTFSSPVSSGVPSVRWLPALVPIRFTQNRNVFTAEEELSSSHCFKKYLVPRAFFI